MLRCLDSQRCLISGNNDFRNDKEKGRNPNTNREMLLFGKRLMVGTPDENHFTEFHSKRCNLQQGMCYKEVTLCAVDT